jgi:DMSO/TMAO reductase YedYZ molybdopterin-dependent catalytic subunit
MNSKLPPGQQARDDFPRFGMTPYAHRFPLPASARLLVSSEGLDSVAFDAPLDGLPGTDITSDFHCVTTWSHRQLHWSGVRFADFYRERIEPLLRGQAPLDVVVLRGQDGYRSSLPLPDLLADDVLLADRLDGQPLPIEHGAPLRLVAPAHYGYKSVKHLSRIELRAGAPAVRPAALAFMDHPRARLAYEERGRWFPGWLLRRAYRPLIGSTVARFAKAMDAYRNAP